MAASLLGTGGFGAIANTASSSAPIIIFDATGQIADSDGGACNVYTITNCDSTNWLWVQVQYTQFGQGGTPTANNARAVPVLPLQTIALQRGGLTNDLMLIRAWTRAANVGPSGTAASGSVNVAGGILSSK